jgi:DNA gyrase subunit A
MLISTGGTVIRMPVEDVKRLGRSTQGVIVMRLRGDERVSALAPVVDSDDEQEGASEGAETTQTEAVAPELEQGPLEPDSDAE